MASKSLKFKVIVGGKTCLFGLADDGTVWRQSVIPEGPWHTLGDQPCPFVNLTSSEWTLLAQDLTGSWWLWAGQISRTTPKWYPVNEAVDEPPA